MAPNDKGMIRARIKRLRRTYECELVDCLPSWLLLQWGVAATCLPAWCSKTFSWMSASPWVSHSQESDPSSLFPCCKAKPQELQEEVHQTHKLKRRWHSHLYPARMFIRVDFPAPDGPMIPTSSRLQNLPDRHLSKGLKPWKTNKIIVNYHYSKYN